MINFSNEFKHCSLLLTQKLSDAYQEDSFYGAQWNTQLTPLFLQKKNVNKGKMMQVPVPAHYIKFGYDNNTYCQILSCVPLPHVIAGTFLS